MKEGNKLLKLSEYFYNNKTSKMYARVGSILVIGKQIIDLILL